MGVGTGTLGKKALGSGRVGTGTLEADAPWMEMDAGTLEITDNRVKTADGAGTSIIHCTAVVRR